MKSASFGVSIRLEWDGERSPDLSCGGDSEVTAILNAITAVLAQVASSSRHTPVEKPVDRF
jgi:hypothetical protein